MPRIGARPNREDQELLLQAADARGGLARALEREQSAQAIEQYRIGVRRLMPMAKANLTSMEACLGCGTIPNSRGCEKRQFRPRCTGVGAFQPTRRPSAASK